MPEDTAKLAELMHAIVVIEVHLHYLKLLKSQDTCFQPEIRAALDAAIKSLEFDVEIAPVMLNG